MNNNDKTNQDININDTHLRAKQDEFEEWCDFNNSPELYEFFTGEVPPVTVLPDFDDSIPF